MASPSTAEVEELIRVAVGRSQADIDSRFGFLLGERVSREQAESAITLIVTEARAEFAETSARIDTLCTGYNEQFEEHKAVIGKIVDEFKVTSAELTSSVTDARVETKTLDEQNAVLRGELGNAFAEQTAKIAGVREEMSKWAAEYKVTVMTMLQQGGGGNGGDQPRSGSGHGAGGKSPTIDKKELSV